MWTRMDHMGSVGATVSSPRKCFFEYASWEKFSNWQSTRLSPDECWRNVYGCRLKMSAGDDDELFSTNWLARQYILFMKTFLHFYDVHSAFTTVPLSLGRLHSELFMLQFMLGFRCERDREPWNCDKSQQPRWLSIWTHFHSIFHSKFLEGNSIHINETAFGFRSNGGFTLLWKFYIVIHSVLHSAGTFFDVFRSGIF